KFLVAAGALLVKGVGPFRNFLITFIRIMAFSSAGLGVHIIIETHSVSPSSPFPELMSVIMIGSRI
ncbi:MAG: hypothetical protein LN411_06550, partial [Candidatus Thermoplasmatota archaeon]|nr:hypothetical protein [Candidatus Thermoplasmatota archaeon]